MSLNQGKQYERLSFRMAWNLAAPHTWPAAVMPTLVAVCAAASAAPVSVSLVIDMLLIVVLMQASVNTFNDYYDYVKGTDSAEDNVDESDAVLVYNNVNPRHALMLAVGMLVAAFVLGIYPIVVAGVAPLVIALIGALFVVLYSAGKSPISYLPLGEAVSGIVMGGLIPLAVYLVLTKSLDWMMLLWALPEIIGVGLIMFTNNVSDVERDVQSGRKTLPVLLGRDKAVIVYRALLLLWPALIALLVAMFFTRGLLMVVFMVIAVYPLMKALLDNPMTAQRRLQSMPQILSLNIVLGAFYAMALLAQAGITIVL